MSMKHSLRRAVLSFSLFSLFSCNVPIRTSHHKTVTIDENEYEVEVERLVIGMEADYAPFNWTEAKESSDNLKITNGGGGYAGGYDVYIAKRLSQSLGMEVDVIKQSFDTLCIDCKVGNINMILAGMTDTEERRQSVDFTDEYYRSEVVLLARKDISEQYEGKTLSGEDLPSLLKGKNVVSQRTTVEDDMIASFVRNYSCYHSPAQETYALACKDVENGTADFLVVELPVAQGYVKSMSGLGIIRLNQDVLGIDLAQLGVSIGVSKDNPGLKSALNAALKKITPQERADLMEKAVERSGN